MSIIEKKLFAFDLDGTLSESKSAMDEEMANLIDRLLRKRKVAIISGGAFEQFQRQMPALKSAPEQLKNLFFFPTTGTRFYRYEGNDWQQVYADELTVEERAKIKDAFEKAFEDIGYKHPETVYGEVVEDRGTQVTFSAVGQQAPLEAKKLWRETQDRRSEIVQALQKYIPEFEAKMPGVTSIDVTRKGIDKAYGILKIEEYLGVKPAEIIFTGDALFEGGNDHAVIRTGVDTQAVTNPEDTKAHLRTWLAELEV
jgi:phosphomannomutase